MNDVAKLNHQETAERVLQVYTKALQDYKQMNSILSEYCILDYFGNIYYKKDKIACHLFTNFHGSVYELASLSVNDPQGSVVEWKPEFKDHKDENSEEDLGVGLISSPKSSFPSVSLSTPVRRLSPATRKHSLSESSQTFFNCKKIKTTCNTGEQSSSSKKLDDVEPLELRAPLSPQSFRTMLPDGIRYLTAYVTIRYSNFFVPSMDPKKKKLRSLVRLCDRFCQLQIGFECEEHVIGVTNCKIWTIKYSVSSRVTPRNLLSSFNEVE